MSMAVLKFKNDNKIFKFFEIIGADVRTINDLEQTDNSIQELVNNNYTTIFLTNEVAGFSESIVKQYNKTKKVHFIIIPTK